MSLGKWHDVDRTNDTHLLIADIGMNQVYIVNTTSGITTRRWQAEAEYPIEGGGHYPVDWTHLNDVEHLDDGRIMVSLRNQDQVAFIDPKTGAMESWTLGAEDAHEILYEQHNLDYIPAENDGPAVVVADSENSRVVEYQREDGERIRSWQWERDSTQWPRDGDRLPNGHTLVTVSNGDRVVEVDENGSVVWSASFLGATRPSASARATRAPAARAPRRPASNRARPRTTSGPTGRAAPIRCSGRRSRA